MNTNDTAAIEQQRKRRNRVNRMKNAIILTISIWMIVSLVTIVILSVAVVHLNNKVNRLTASAEMPTNKVIEHVATESQQIEPESVNSQENLNSYEYVKNGIDSEDNKAEAGDTHEVYLTFDSTPGENTGKILDVLKEYDVKATFFVSGDKSDEAKAVYKRIVQEGHTLGMHSYTNQYSTIYASTEAFEKDYDKLAKYLKKVTGTDSLYYRFPGGSGNQISNVDMAEFVHVLNEKKISYFDWNVSAGDASEDYTAEDIVNNVMEGITNYKTSIVLLHDGEDKSTTVEALGSLIEALRNADAKILPIDEHTKVIQYIKADSVE